MLWAGFFFLVISVVAPRLTADTLTLKSGETIEGEIRAETNDVVQISVPNARRTIYSLKSISRSDIKEIQHATAEQKAYAEVERYRLDANSFSMAYYDKTIQGVFQKFLTDYPSSTRTSIIVKAIAQWTAERDKVAGGTVKWGGRWYEGDAVKNVAGQIKATQLLDDGDRRIGSSQYEQAIAKYREALAVRPLPASLIEQISGKVNTAAERWKAALATGATTVSANVDVENQNLQSMRVGCQKAINNDVVEQNRILSAKTECVRYGSGGVCLIKHWFAQLPYRFDYGAVLPDPHSYDDDIRHNRDAIAKIDEQIAANNARKAGRQDDQATAGTQLQKINTTLQQFSSDLAQARADSQRMEAEDAGRKAEKARRKADDAMRLAAGPAAAQTQLATSQVVPAPEPQTVATVGEVPVPPAQSIWTWLRVNWVIPVVVGVGLLWVILRCLDK